MRELANAVEYAVNMEQTAYISFESLPVRVREGMASPAAVPAVGVLRSAEAEAIRRALNECGESLEGKKRAAAMLGISLATLYRKIKEMGEGRAGREGVKLTPSASPTIAVYGLMLSCLELAGDWQTPALNLPNRTYMQETRTVEIGPNEPGAG